MKLVRDARPDEASALEALQRRASDVWEEYRAQLAANPDAIEAPHLKITGQASTRFGNAPRMSLELSPGSPAPTHSTSSSFTRAQKPHR